MTDYKKLLNSFKRSNKDRKLKLAQKAGFITIGTYLDFLEEKASGSTEDTEAPIIDVPASEEITDLVIAFDTTGSMGSYIVAVKKHVKQLIPNLFKQNPGLHISVVAFGDYCDMKSATKFDKAYQVIELTRNENDLINFVEKAQDTSGGDGDEFYELVIKKITEETQWRKGSNKSVLLIADDEPHGVGYSYGVIVNNAQIDWKEEAKKAADLGIKFDTLRIKSSVTWYAELSRITNGVCLDFSNSNKTSDLLEATALARGGSATKFAFMAKSVSSEVTMDGDLSKVYSMYKTVVDK